MIIFVIWLFGLLTYKICCVLITRNKSSKVIMDNNEFNLSEREEVTKEDNEEEIELPKRRDDGTIINLYEEPEMPRTIEEWRKERVLENLTKKFDDNQSMIDGLFTVEEYKELSKLLHDMKKNKKA